MAFGKIKKRIKNKLLARLLKGNNVACNICKHTYSSFLPYLNRANALCPNCGSLERTRLIYYFTDKLELVKPGMQLLHVAPEECLFHIFRSKLGAGYIPADKFEEIYNYPTGTRYMDVTDIPLENDSVDVVICVHVLEHVADDKKAIAEIYRVLKKGGVAILQVPFEQDRAETYEDESIITPAERRKHFGQFDHVRIYGRDHIQRFLAPGFTMEQGDFSKNIDVKTRERYVLKTQEVFLLRK